MASTRLPTILLIPGAFGTPDGYEKLVPYIEQAGLSTHPGPYPSCDPEDPSNATSEKDINSLRDYVLLPLLDREQNDVVIIAHSYGGVVGGAAAKGLDRLTRNAQGKTTAVVGLIYVAGNITLEGESLLEAVGGEYPPFIKRDNVSITRRVREGEEAMEPVVLLAEVLTRTKTDPRQFSAAFQGSCFD